MILSENLKKLAQQTELR